MNHGMAPYGNGVLIMTEATEAHAGNADPQKAAHRCKITHVTCAAKLLCLSTLNTNQLDHVSDIC